MKNILGYKEINYWRIEFVILYWWETAQLSMGHPLKKAFIQDHHSAWYQVLPGSDGVAKCFEEVITCCKSLHTPTLCHRPLRRSSWYRGRPMQSVCIRSWLLWVQSIFSSQNYECGKVRMVRTRLQEKLSVDWLDFAFFIHPSVMSGIPSWSCLSATLGGGDGSTWSPPLPSHACNPEGTGQPYHLPLSRASGKPLPFRSWYLGCSIAPEKQVANCYLKKYLKSTATWKTT